MLRRPAVEGGIVPDGIVPTHLAVLRTIVRGNVRSQTNLKCHPFEDASSASNSAAVGLSAWVTKTKKSTSRSPGEDKTDLAENAQNADVVKA